MSRTQSTQDRGLERTLRVLVRSKNVSATDVLVSALDTSARHVQEKVLEALLQRTDPRGHLAIIERWPKWSDYLKQKICQKGERLTAAITQVLESAEERLFAHGCQVAVAVREYGAIAPLLRAIEDATSPRSRLAARTVLELTESLYEELVTPRDYRERRDPQRVHQHVLGNLELTLLRSTQNVWPEVLEAFLLLANTDNPFLRRVLEDTSHPLHGSVRQALEISSRAGVFRLLIRYLDTAAPPAALEVLSRRNDVPFLRRLARTLAGNVSEAMKRNLQRISHYTWWFDLSAVLALADDEQAALVKAVALSSASPETVVETLGRFFDQATPAAKQAAIAALTPCSTPEADQLIVRALQSPEPTVQAEAVRQVRKRSIPDAVALLLGLIDTPHPPVREAIREALTELNTARYLQAFDLLSEEVRGTAGTLVRKLDPQAPSTLRTELVSASRLRRLRGLQAATAMQLVLELQDEIMTLLEDDDHFVRADAARALGQARGARVVHALQQALHDRSPAVREAARQALQTMAERQAPPPVQLNTAVSVNAADMVS